MIRLFAGLDLPDPIRARLAMLAGGLPGARWVPAENYHLTLRFVGEVQGWKADEIDSALAGITARGFELVLAGLGCFEKGRRAHALWVGVEKNPALMLLQGKIETALQRVGLEPERRKFTPHVAIARLDNPGETRLTAFIQAHNLFRTPPMAVDHFSLFSSRLGREGARYEIEADYALGEPALRE